MEPIRHHRSGVIHTPLTTILYNSAMEHGQTNEGVTADDGFRPFKRRRVYRKREDDDEASGEGSPSKRSRLNSAYQVDETPSQLSDRSDDEIIRGGQAELPIAEIIKRRKAAQRRRGGIEFSNAAPVAESSDAPTKIATEVLDNEESLDKILTVVDRFAPQTGQVADVDKHMYAVPRSYSLFQAMRVLTA